jgi:hypothetical protein
MPANNDIMYCFVLHIYFATILNRVRIHTHTLANMCGSTGHSATCVVQQFDTVMRLVGAALNHHVVATNCSHHEGLASMDMDVSKQ